MFTIKYNFLILLLLITLFGAFLRFYKILEFPIQLNHDEITQLYDAWSVATTGKDIYGNFMPFIFESVNDHKPPFYTYATAVFYFLLGNNEITIKAPGLIAGILAIPVVYFFTLQLINNRQIALLAAFLTSIAPFELFYSRKSFENGSGVVLMMLGFGLILSHIKANSKIKLFLSAVILGLSMYVYFSQAVIIPLLILVFLSIFKKQFFNLKNFKVSLASLVIWLFIALPLFITIFAIPETRFRSSDVFVLQDPNLGNQIQLVDDVNFVSIIQKNYLVAGYAFTRFLSQFDIEYLFFNGLEFTKSRIVDIGPLYLIQLPLLIIGIYFLIKTKGQYNQKLFMLLWILVGMIPSGITFEQYSPHRVIMVFVMLNIISSAGFYYLFILLQNILFLKKLTILSFSAIFLYSLFYFFHIYTINFPFEKSQNIHYPFKEVALYASSVKENYNQVIFDPLFGEDSPEVGTAAHYYLGYYGNIPPTQMQKEYRLGDNSKREALFDKYSIRKVDWREDQNLKDTLIIASKWSLFEDTITKGNVIKVFYFYNGEPAFYAIKL